MVTAFKWVRLLSELYQSLKLLSEVPAEGQARSIEAIKQPKLQANVSGATTGQVRWPTAIPAELLFPERSKSAMQLPSLDTSICLHVAI